MLNFATLCVISVLIKIKYFKYLIFILNESISLTVIDEMKSSKINTVFNNKKEVFNPSFILDRTQLLKDILLQIINPEIIKTTIKKIANLN